MKNKLLAIFVIASAILYSCAPTKTIVDTSCPGYKNIDFSKEDLKQYGVGVMPVLGGEEREQFRRPMGDAMTKYLRKEVGEGIVKSPDEVIRLINNANITDRYTQAINDYRTTGIVPKDMISQLGEGLGVKYLLYTRLLTDTEFASIYTGSYYPTTIRIDEIYAQCQVWDTELGDIVWEGKGGTAKLPANPTDVIDKTAEGLALVIGNDIGKGPCETKSQLVNSVQQATTNTYLATFGITLAVCLLILAL